MIRLPFSSDSDWKSHRKSAPAGGAWEERSVGEAERLARIEVRLAALELKLTSHAEELTTQVSERVLRIQSRLESALRPFQSQGEEFGEGELEEIETVVAFEGGAMGSHHLHAHNACEALYELNETLKMTKDHLEALASSIDRMKRAVAGR